MKEIKIDKQNCWRLLLVVLLLILSSVVIIIKPYYKVEDRTDKVKNYKGVSGEKALGWLRVQGTNIDFPIVYYYDTDVTDPTNDLGWSFSNKKTLQEKTTIFSHNILNVSSKPLIADKNHKRFEQLLSFIYTDFLKKNKYIEYTTNGKNYLFKIYGVSFFGDNTDYSFVVDARMVRKNELISNYSLKEQKNYDKIKEIMKGDADNV